MYLLHFELPCNMTSTFFSRDMFAVILKPGLSLEVKTWNVLADVRCLTLDRFAGACNGW
jgi:hypothetical protein